MDKSIVCGFFGPPCMSEVTDIVLTGNIGTHTLDQLLYSDQALKWPVMKEMLG